VLVVKYTFLNTRDVEELINECRATEKYLSEYNAKFETALNGVAVMKKNPSVENMATASL
jgi:hypothetical protein